MTPTPIPSYSTARCKETNTWWWLLTLFSVASAQVTVPMSQYDAARTGANLQETVLNPTNVNQSQFGRLFTREVDYTIYAEPLIVPGVEIGGVRRNLLLVATMNNTVYAFDADDAARTQAYWTRNLGPFADPDPGWIGPDRWGILGTPFADTTTNTLYLVAKTKTGSANEMWVHALNLADGFPKYNSPQRLSFAFAGGPTLTDIGSGIQRAGLLVTGHTLVVAFANIRPTDRDSQEGFVQSFDATDLRRKLGTFQVTPNGLKGGIWQAGRGVATDGKGSIYFATAGGSFDGKTDFGSSILKLNAVTLALEDSFTPSNHEALYHGNLDPSAGGVTLIPGTRLLFAGGKEGVLYLLNQDGMGKLEGADKGPLQRFQASQGCRLTDCTQTLGTAFWSLGTQGIVYVWDRGDVLRAYRFTNGLFETTPFSTGSHAPMMTGGPVLSANGGDLGSGIVWAITTENDANDTLVPGTLRAFLATDLSREIYNSDSNRARDVAGLFTKFATPVVANGKVYVPTHSNRISVYGLLPTQVAAVPRFDALANVADYTQRVAPQALVALFGKNLATGTCSASVLPLPNQLCGVSLLLSQGDKDALAPLLFVSPDQINFQMPASQYRNGKDAVRGASALATTTDLCLMPSRTCAAVPLTEQAPAVFLYARSAEVVDPIIVHLNGQLVSPTNSAVWGESLTLYATGLGYLGANFPPDGAPAPLDRLVALEGSSPIRIRAGQSTGEADVTVQADFVGLAPGFIGLWQINFTLPSPPPSQETYFVYLVGSKEGESRRARLYVR